MVTIFSKSAFITSVRATNAASREIIEDTTERSKPLPFPKKRTPEISMPAMPQFCRRKPNLSCHLSLFHLHFGRDGPVIRASLSTMSPLQPPSAASTTSYFVPPIFDPRVPNRVLIAMLRRDVRDNTGQVARAHGLSC